VKFRYCYCDGNSGRTIFWSGPQSSPKSVRFTLSQRIENLALDVLGQLTRPRFSTGRMRANSLVETDILLAQLRALLRMAHARRALDHRAHPVSGLKPGKRGERGGHSRYSSGRIARTVERAPLLIIRFQQLTWSLPSSCNGFTVHPATISLCILQRTQPPNHHPTSPQRTQT